MHKRILILASILSLMCARIDAQINLKGVSEDIINPALLSPGEWPASWIAAPGLNLGYGVFHFRRSFELASKPDKFVVNVSADARYKLYVNGALVCYGPAKGNDRSWCFETVDIAEFLQAGDNVIAALVWHQGTDAPAAQMTHGGAAFILQGNGKEEEIVNTGSGWLVCRNAAYQPVSSAVNGYYAAGACDRVEDALYPWGWQNIEFDDSGWSKAAVIRRGAIKGTPDYPEWQLIPRPIPQMEHNQFTVMKETLRVEPDSEREILLDNMELITGYPIVRYSGGKGSTIELAYAEALYNTDTLWSYDKGNRNETEGKFFIGYHDEILPDGGMGRTFEPLWWRTWRYLKIKVRTGSEPLVIDGIDGLTSMYPLTLDSGFKASGASGLDKILEVGWRTARLCAHETYMDCPYYEQLQYFGDSRIQALVTMFNSRDSRLVTSLIEQGRQSMVSDGITMSRYPSSIHQFIPTFSLLWICTAHDYWMYRGDEKYLKTLLPAFRSVLSWYESFLGDDNCLHDIPYWVFADWCGIERGVMPKDKLGRSSFIDQVYIMALQMAAEMEDSFGNPAIGKAWKSLADRMKLTFNGWYWDKGKRMYACNSDRKEFSQHVNALAIITGTIDGLLARDLFDRTLANKDILQCTIYFRYYLQEAMKRCGRAEVYLDNLDIWKDQLALGLTTWAEEPEPTRSDCHAWGASPNIEFYRMVAGIDSGAPGFAKVVIEPALGPLTRLDASIPHPKGEVRVNYVLRKKHLTAEMNLPKDVTGVFRWNGKEFQLNGGRNKVMISRQ